jgi:hypothetical protein
MLLLKNVFGKKRVVLNSDSFFCVILNQLFLYGESYYEGII